MLEQNVFVRSGTLQGVVEVESASGTALASHEKLASVLAERLSPRAAGLFARPALTHGNGEAETAVSWYVGRAGAIRSWGALSKTEQDQVGASVARSLNEMEPLLADPAIGPDLAAWLNVPSLNDDLIVVGNEPHFVNWGLLPADIAGDTAARAQHFKETFGRFGLSPDKAMPPAAGDAGEAAAHTYAPNAAPVAATAAATVIAVTPRAPWVPLAIATAIAALVLLLLPFVLLTPDPGLPSAVRDGIGKQADEALRKRIGELQQQLSVNSCRPPGGVPAPLAPAGRPLEGAPATPGNPGNPAAAPSPAPRTDVPPPAAPRNEDRATVAPSPTTDLVNFLDQVTALVVSRSPKGMSMGTAFFVNERQLVTNLHVIDGAEADQVVLASRAFGKSVPARVIAKTRNFKFGSPDFAVLEVEGVSSSKSLVLSTQAERLQNVIAAGYPGFVMETDAEFQQLKRGDPSSIPQSAVTQGSIVALQKGSDSKPIIAHTAPISPGNSGGPLVDQCARAVGVNTFERTNQASLARLGFALGTENLRAFLDENRIAYKVADEICSQPVRQAEVVPSAPPAQAPAAPSPAPAAPAAAPAAK